MTRRLLLFDCGKSYLNRQTDRQTGSLHLFYVDVLLGAGLKHADAHRISKLHRVRGVHLFPGWVVVLISHWNRKQKVDGLSEFSSRTEQNI